MSRAKFKGGGASGRRAEVLRAIAASARLTTAERCVLFVLEAHVGYADRDTGRAWPSVATVARCAGLRERWTRACLARLEAGGWLKVSRRSERGAQITSVYVVTPPEIEAELDEPEPEPEQPIH